MSASSFAERYLAFNVADTHVCLCAHYVRGRTWNPLPPLGHPLKSLLDYMADGNGLL